MAETESKLDSYVCTRSCVYRGRWYPRGAVINVVAGTKVEHACFEKANKRVAKTNTKGVFYNPTQEAIEKKRIDDAMVGIVRN